MQFSLEELHPSWRPFFAPHVTLIQTILDGIDLSDCAPPRSQVFRAFTESLDDVKVVIFGQDPYPGELVADGLAFSTPIINKVPASLRNIFKEYQSDLSLPAPTTSDLTPWSRSGVLLLNRSLTTISGARNAHQASQWKVLTESIAQMLGERDVVAILWGNFARELSPLFALKIESAHPSPLSAHRGFFGSRPFTRANALLEGSGRSAIEWKLG